MTDTGTPSENLVAYAGADDTRDFLIEEPDTGEVIAILNILGTVGVRAEATAVRLMKKPTAIGTLMGLLAVLKERDLRKLADIVLQVREDKRGRNWLEDQPLKVAPIVQALFMNIEQSDDLAESIAAFFGGIERVMTVLNRLAPMIGMPDLTGLALAGSADEEDEESSAG